MKYVITGGAGFIGSNIAEALSSDKSIEIIIIDDLSSGKVENIEIFDDKKNISFINGTITNSDLVEETVKGADGIFHQAAIASVQRSVEEPDMTNEVNLTGTLNVLNAARKNDVRKVVMASSAAVYGDNPNMPLGEDEKPKPMTPYAVQKLTGEYYAEVFSALYNISAVALRYFNVYGPRQDPKSPYSGVISIFSDKISAGEPITIYGDGHQTRDFIYVGDVVQANLSAMGLKSQDGRFRKGKGASGGVYNVATGRETDLLQLASALMVINRREVYIDFNERRPGDINKSLASVKKAAAPYGEGGFGFSAKTEIKEGLLKLKEYNERY
ncbi:NAD-dependent epimerase/dehydratase family protein [Methanoplanus endosymbiosus]|uniref:NAD-dependent epimerase/dehydratase family protein n=1 Tax=Methanoplanus endosymbiosus TaxID=33865 RepID=A0A9E7PRM1_9EURY|nr:NAD-dependent epimerase/dehydratase family protein [Methanoplanus endosymbiosus]UUX92317.1 NAD-dependent epimerase/dehydratase family protein [Methanoplanus endosymbiosus]